MPRLHLANAGPVTVKERGKHYVCVPNTPMEKEDLDRTVRALCNRSSIPFPVVNPERGPSFNSKMRLDVTLDSSGKEPMCEILCDTKVFEISPDSITTYLFYRKTDKDKVQELTFKGKDIQYSRACLFIVDDAIHTPTWFFSDERPQTKNENPPTSIVAAEIADEYNLIPRSQWSLETNRDPELAKNPFLTQADIDEECIAPTEAARNLLAIPAATTPKVPHLSEIPSMKDKIAEQYKIPSNTASSLQRMELLLNALTPLKDKKLLKKYKGDFIIAVTPEGGGRNDEAEVEGCGVSLPRKKVEGILLHIALCNQEKNTFVGRIVEEEDTSMLAAVLDKLPGTAFSVVSKDVLEIPEEEL